MTSTRPPRGSVFLVEDEVMIRMMVADMLDLIKARNRPFIFATGYGSSGLPEEYRDRPALQKPFQLETLGKMIDNALRSASA